MLQQQRPVLLSQLHGGGGQQGLAHGGLQGGFQAVEVHPLVGGVLVHQPDLPRLALADDVGPQQLPGNPPGGLAGGLQGLLPRQLRLGNGGNEGPGFRQNRLLWKGGLCQSFRLRRDGGRRFHSLRLRPEDRGRSVLPQGREGPAPPQGRAGRKGRRAVRQPGAGPLRVPGGKGRGGPGGRGGGLCPLFPVGFRVHGLEEVPTGVHGFLRVRRSGGNRPSLLRQGVQHSVVERVENGLLLGEFYLGLGGVDVHVHRRHRQGHRQHAAGEAALHDLVPVALFQSGGQKLGLDEPPVDEKDLHPPGAPALEGPGDEARYRRAVSAPLHGKEAPGEVPAQGGVNSGVQPPVSGGVEGLRAVLDESEGHVRVGQGQVLHQAAGRRRLGAVLFHEFQPGGGVVEKVPDQDGGALRGSGLLHRAGNAPLQAQRRAGGVLPPPGLNLHPADGGDGRQGLPPEAQGADFSQVLGPPQLGGGVAQKGRGQLRGGDAAAVVRHPDKAHAAPAELHHHGGAMGVQGVFHQLLYHAGGALHHLPGGNEVRHVRGQLLNAGHGASSFPGALKEAAPR